MKLDDYIDNSCIGPGFRMASAMIVGPYPTREFIDQVLEWQPEKIVLAVDDGWPQERIEEIMQTCAKTDTTLLLRRVAPALGSGLVHAKLYCLEWRNAADNYRRHTLLAGSANASSQGFGLHAETFVHIDLANLDRLDKKAALGYFSALEHNYDAPAATFALGGRSWITMPALEIIRTPWPNGFDAWIRRGRLCHSYQPDPTFGRLVLRLKASLLQGQLGANLVNSGFNAVGEAQSFTRPYVHYSSGVAEEKKEQQTWRRRYFTETVYGYWTSAECFASLESEFVAPQAEGRQRALDTIRTGDPQQRTSWINSFIRSVREVFEGLPEDEREKYFHVRPNGELDEERYRQQASDKLYRDQAKSTDPYFCSRFTSGFAFPPVPALGDGFDEFVLELCSNLLAKLQSRQVRNRLAATLRDQRIADAGTTREELLALLRSRWDEIRHHLVDFYVGHNQAYAWCGTR